MLDFLAVLKNTGLSEKEAQVYLALLALGQASVTEVARRANLKRPTVYLALAELELLGLVSTTKKGKRTVYSAAHPRRLGEMARLRSSRVEEVLPQLLALSSVAGSKPTIQVFEGEKGVDLVYRDLYESLGRKEEVLFFADTTYLQERFPAALVNYKKVMRTLSRPRVRELNLDNEAGRAWAADMTRLMRGNPHYGHRLLPATFALGATDTMIFGSTVALFCFSKEIFVVTIESAEIANTLRALFEWAWKSGKKV